MEPPGLTPIQRRSVGDPGDYADEIAQVGLTFQIPRLPGLTPPQSTGGPLASSSFGLLLLQLLPPFPLVWTPLPQEAQPCHADSTDPLPAPGTVGAAMNISFMQAVGALTPRNPPRHKATFSTSLTLSTSGFGLHWPGTHCQALDVHAKVPGKRLVIPGRLFLPDHQDGQSPKKQHWG